MSAGTKVKIPKDATQARKEESKREEDYQFYTVKRGAKRRRKIVRRDNGKVVEFEEVRYGMLMMVLCVREGRVYDVWITFGSVHEVRAFRERKKRMWQRPLVCL